VIVYLRLQYLNTSDPLLSHTIFWHKWSLTFTYNILTPMMTPSPVHMRPHFTFTYSILTQVTFSLTISHTSDRLPSLTTFRRKWSLTFSYNNLTKSDAVPSLTIS